jgi:hypothetical protein
MNDSLYNRPQLKVYGRVEDLTGTWNKRLGYPSDTNWKFIPIADKDPSYS